MNKAKEQNKGTKQRNKAMEWSKGTKQNNNTKEKSKGTKQRNKVIIGDNCSSYKHANITKIFKGKIRILLNKLKLPKDTQEYKKNVNNINSNTNKTI